ncbi:cyclic lactone autoinducer peptide [Alkaliphilus serpentinus]|uniref:Cyclic lactone autoinducer peptide n=1 Tax=Alkaliphilus serpentinus TaxID=1482731 RepID=A0A833HPE4_9FIRM|nr:cyclic lactone autoinducer peptide [Alkaliphilus serpentinus]KAB3530567.1 cyclic lactone autoinducer peptide [Alkaliphilus serpentinus]
MKRNLLKMVASLAVVFAGLGVSINCFGMLYQPKAPQRR